MNEPRRRLWIRWFLGDTVEAIERQVGLYLSNECICPGNYIDLKLWKHGDVYQAALIHALLIEEPSSSQPSLRQR